MRGQSSPPAPPGSALRTRLRISAAIGLAILGAWLYYTVNAVLGLYDVTLSIATRLTAEEKERLNGSAQRILRKGTDLRHLVTEALSVVERLGLSLPVPVPVPVSANPAERTS
jgi:hypothetical protein